MDLLPLTILIPMTCPSPAPLLVFRVLADRRGLPSGLLIEAGAAMGEARLASAVVDDLGALCRDFPCLYRPSADPCLAAALAGHGWSALAERTLFRAGERFTGMPLPPEARWIDGDWCLGAPAKVLASQAASRTLALQLVQLVAADADTHEIEALLRLDPTMSYQLLRLVNSLGMGAVRRITSFGQALLILGRQQLRRWLNLMLFAAQKGDIRSPMLLARVAVRARALELLARTRGLDKLTQEQAFMTGMFSLLGILFGLPLASLLAPLSISESVQGALLHHDGELGALLALVELAEQGEPDALAPPLAALQIAADDFNSANLEAHRWMLAALRDSGASGHG
ncbi:EAL and HDOD domain-containing protein [Massilia sp. CCM 8734]|uniref:EAL and HDOD domain-containing protein n=1 Tax=Massilia sp. CCM 8734 TaxID=2609283 RepID=UPI0014208B3B|nr:HDOD domain-containing protein [Massilia sp. CCM 8734]NHZ95466.1 HDOD domain-containing protein [Massilia sp. CCM 8734]